VIRKRFPELRLVARGNEIKVLGDEKNIHQFSEKINRLIQHYQKFGSLTVENVEHFLSENGKETNPQQVQNTAMYWCLDKTASWFAHALPTRKRCGELGEE